MECLPLIPERWSDFEELFGPRGAYAGCWCMWWRLPRREFEAQQGEGNRRAMKALVDSGAVPGIIGYVDGLAMAWCSVAPRDQFGSLNRSRVLKPLDDQPVWSLVCHFVAREYRGRGLIRDLIVGAIGYVRAQGGTIVEAYPSVIRSKKAPPTTSFMGFIDVFAAAGFVECARPSAAKCIMRFVID